MRTAKTAIPPTLLVSSDGSMRTPGSHDLVNSLTRQLVLGCEVGKRQTVGVFQTDRVVPLVVGGRPRLERTPLPSGDAVEGFDPVGGKCVALVPLPAVGAERTEFDLCAVHDLNVQGRDSCVPFAVTKLLEGVDVCVETRGVVHIGYTS